MWPVFRKGKVMNSRHRKRSVVAGSVLILALATTGLQPASAATAPSATHDRVATAVQKVDNDYRRGFRDGFRDGWSDARKDCKQHHRRGFAKQRGSSYARGYSDGYSAGFSRAEHRYC
jgi:flagellar biosynthesis/type III secretory pathway protein FliH